MTMREKIARAMDEKRKELIAQPLARIWPDLADAALSAMREPTPQMAEAGCRATLPYDEGDAARAYRAMIDAAIGEGK